MKKTNMKKNQKQRDQKQNHHNHKNFIGIYLFALNIMKPKR